MEFCGMIWFCGEKKMFLKWREFSSPFCSSSFLKNTIFVDKRKWSNRHFWFCGKILSVLIWVFGKLRMILPNKKNRKFFLSRKFSGKKFSKNRQRIFITDNNCVIYNTNYFCKKRVKKMFFIKWFLEFVF